MSHRRRTSVRAAVTGRLRAAAVLLACLATAVPLLVAAGDDDPELVGTDAATVSVVAAARAQLGDDYVWGATGPDEWDCSGLTSVIWRTVGGVKDIPRTSAQQQAWAVPIPEEQLLPGDLVFFGAPVTHVGIYSSGGRMVDASSSRTGVVERTVWKSGVVRYGRVPRPGMPAVRPWTPPPAPSPSPSPSASPSASPSPSAVAVSANGKPDVAKAPATRATPAPVTPLAGLPGTQKAPSSAVASKAVAGALSVQGSTAFTDVRLVREAWRHAGGGTLPTTRAALTAQARTVPLADARVGDLVVYGPAANPTHVAFYTGHGYMVAASASYGKVLVRRVFAAPVVRLARLG